MEIILITALFLIVYKIIMMYLSPIESMVKKNSIIDNTADSIIKRPQELYSAEFIKKLQSVCEGSKVFVSTLLAIGHYESNAGEGRLSKIANNYFGLKASPNSFRVYSDRLSSFIDYIEYLQKYHYSGVLNATTPEDQIKQIYIADCKELAHHYYQPRIMILVRFKYSRFDVIRPIFIENKKLATKNNL